MCRRNVCWHEVGNDLLIVRSRNVCARILICLPGLRPGKYSTSSTSSCRPCAGGTYAGTKWATTYSSCGAGTYALTSSTACLACEPGKYSTSSTSGCSSCDRGTYSSAAARMRVYVCANVFVCVCVCVCVFKCIDRCKCTHKDTCVHVCMYVYTHPYTCMYTHTHPHTHTFKYLMPWRKILRGPSGVVTRRMRVVQCRLVCSYFLHHLYTVFCRQIRVQVINERLL